MWDDDFLKRGFYFAADAEGGAAVAELAEAPGEEVPVEETPEPEAVVDEQPEPAVDEIYGTLEAFGIPREREAASAHLRQLTAQAQQNAQLRAMLWQIEQQRNQPAAPAPAADAAPKLPWELPKFDPRLKQQLVYDAEGNLTVRPGGPPNLVAEYQQYQQAREDALDKLLADPYGVMQPGLMPLIRAEAQRIAQEQLQQQSQQFAEQQFQARLQGYYVQNKKWLEDETTGQPTQWAWTWGNAVKQARQMGHPDPLAFADQVIDAELFRFQQTQPAAPAAPASGSKAQMDYLKARNKPGRAGAQARPNGKKSPPPDEDPFARLETRFQEIYAHDPDDFKKHPPLLSSRN